MTKTKSEFRLGKHSGYSLNA